MTMPCSDRMIKRLSTDSVNHWFVESVISEEQRRSALVATVSLFSDADTLAFVVLQETNRAVHERRRKKSNFFIGTIILLVKDVVIFVAVERRTRLRCELAGLILE